MKSRKIVLSFEKAKEWFNGSDQSLKTLALETYPELNKKITDRIKTFDDVLTELKITPEAFEVVRNTLNVEGFKYLFAQWKVEQIAKALNEDWEPDWDDSNEYKYYPWFDMRSSGGGFSFSDYGYGRTDSIVGSRLCFKSYELSTYAATQFKDIYEQMFKG